MNEIDKIIKQYVYWEGGIGEISEDDMFELKNKIWKFIESLIDADEELKNHSWDYYEIRKYTYSLRLKIKKIKDGAE